MITADLTRECFYLPEGSGVPHWKERPLSHFGSRRYTNAFNTKCAGRPAGTNTRADSRRRIVFTVLGKRHSVYAYHVVWMLVHGVAPTNQIDHRDGDCTNDAIENLREATQSQNNANTRRPSHNTSGFKGVSWQASSKRFRAYIKLHGRMRHLGHFLSAEAAAKAYAAAAASLFGEFARPA